MDINELGTYASIIALAVIAISGALKLAKKYRRYIAKNAEEDEKYIKTVIGSIKESSTAIERADSAYYVQQVLSRDRHLMTVAYIQIVIFMLAGLVAFNVSIYFDEWRFGGVFLFIGVLFSVVNYLFLRNIAKQLAKLEEKASYAFAENLDKTFSRKTQRKAR